MVTFKLPDLGEGVHEGELVKWKVKKGDFVKYDQLLCEVMTDKATIEIPSAIEGKVAQLHAKEGDTVHVEQLMLSFESEAGEQEPVASPVVFEKLQEKFQEKAHSSLDPMIDLNPLTRVLASPLTRKLAKEQGIDLRMIQGSGPHGRVMREDLNAIQSVAPKEILPPFFSNSSVEKRVPFIGLRKKIAEKMRLSKDHAAHFTYVEEADATTLVALRKEAKEWGARQGIKITYLPFIMKAMVASLKQYPILNASLDEQSQEIVYKSEVSIGLSIQTEDGLMAPVVRAVNQKSLFQIARDIETLVERARTKRLTVEDFKGGTITLTNIGSIGGLFSTPVIQYPEVAILGFNKIFRKPVVKTLGGKEEIVIRDWTYFSISLDHRVVDGAIGADFMKLFIQMIENPSLLLFDFS